MWRNMDVLHIEHGKAVQVAEVRDDSPVHTGLWQEEQWGSGVIHPKALPRRHDALHRQGRKRCDVPTLRSLTSYCLGRQRPQGVLLWGKILSCCHFHPTQNTFIFVFTGTLRVHQFSCVWEGDTCPNTVRTQWHQAVCTWPLPTGQPSDGRSYRNGRVLTALWGIGSRLNDEWHGACHPPFPLYTYYDQREPEHWNAVFFEPITQIILHSRGLLIQQCNPIPPKYTSCVLGMWHNCML